MLAAVLSPDIPEGPETALRTEIAFAAATSSQQTVLDIPRHLSIGSGQHDAHEFIMKHLAQPDNGF
jgi:hypothetical protein